MIKNFILIHISFLYLLKRLSTSWKLHFNSYHPTSGGCNRNNLGEALNIFKKNYKTLPAQPLDLSILIVCPHFVSEYWNNYFQWRTTNICEQIRSIVPFWHDVRTYFTKNSWPFHHTAIYWMQYWICRSMNMDHAMWTY